MKKKAKIPQGRANTSRVVDPNLVARQAEAALARGEVDAACQLLAQARPKMGPLNRELGARAFVAHAYARWDRPARALESLERALEWEPARADLRRLRGNLLRRLGRLKLARAELAEAQRLTPGDRQIAFESLLTRLASGETATDLTQLTSGLNGPLARRSLALIAALRNDPSAAVVALSSPEASVDKLMRAVLLLAQGQAIEAIPSLEDLARQAQLPSAVQAYTWSYLGIARAHQREPMLACEAFDRAQSLGAPEGLVRAYQSWVYLQFASDAVLGDDLSAAAEWFGRLEKLGGAGATTARDNVVHALSLLGQRRAQAEDYDGAADAWSQAIILSPRDAALRQNLAIVLERASRSDEAIPHWQELVRQMPRKIEGTSRTLSGSQSGGDEDDLNAHIRVTAHRHLADLYVEQDDDERAIEQLERALRIMPLDVDTRKEIGRLLMDGGQIAKAIPHFEQVVAACPNSADDHFELGLAQITMGNERSGVEHLETSLSLDPGRPFARFALGTALAQRVLQSPGAPTALGDAQRAVDLVSSGDSVVGLIAYAAAQLARGDRRGAMKTFKEAEKKTGDKLRTFLAMGNVYWQAGDRDDALAAWAKVTGKAKSDPCLYALLTEAWAKAGDGKRCQECLLASLDHSEEEAIGAIKRIAKSGELQPLLRDVLHKAIPSTDDLLSRVYLAEGLVYAGDVQGARSTLRGVVRQAMEEEDHEAIDVAVDLDLRYNNTLLDRKTSVSLLDWLDHNLVMGGRNW